MLPQTVLVIFGVSGDLSRRYLLPALAAIKEAGQLPENFKVLGVSRREIKAKDILEKKTKTLKKHLEIIQLDTEQLGHYRQLKTKIYESAKGSNLRAQIVFYLTIPPDAVTGVITRLGESGLNTKNVKLMLEKPFGTDYQSAKKLVSQTNKYFDEDQLYRIDHYLAKEVAQNIVVFLGSNALFRDVWSGDFIEKIEILASETIGVESRTNLWEKTGTLRDFVQSHLLQLTALTLMEPCQDVFNLKQVAAHRQAALDAIDPANPKQVFAAQYKGYRQEARNPNSKSETFTDLTLYSKDPRWKGVPIRLTTGKKLDKKLTEIRVFFKKQHHSQSNLLTLRIQPREGIELDLWVKSPGYARKLQKLSLSFSYSQHFQKLPDAYEQVLVDAFSGSHGIFASSHEVLKSWEILQPVLGSWQKEKKLTTYVPGSTMETILRKISKKLELPLKRLYNHAGDKTDN